jgi:two-component system sensor histidine kinase HydH
MTTASTLRPVARWSLVAIIALLAAVLAVTAWTTWGAVNEASATLVRGQANALQQAIRGHLMSLGESPTVEGLNAILEAEQEAGLRYVAVMFRDETVLEAGTPVEREFRRTPPEQPVFVRGRVRMVFRAKGPPLGPRGFLLGGSPGRAFMVAMELEPLQAIDVRKAAARTFWIGTLSASVLLVGAAVLLRWLLRQAEDARAQERERRLASLGEMSAVLAHEIRNPLASLKGNAQLLAETLRQGTDEKQKSKADRVVAEAIRLEQLTNDLIDYVKTGELRKATVDPSELLRSCVESLGESSTSVTIDSGRAPPSWTLDGTRVRQVLINLLENAVQAGAPVTARVKETRGQLVYEVADSGPGVPEDERERIFEPFFTKRLQGTGLGLAIARRWVELHHGTLTVSNGHPQGAVFTVSLP